MHTGYGRDKKANPPSCKNFYTIKCQYALIIAMKISINHVDRDKFIVLLLYKFINNGNDKEK